MLIELLLAAPALAALILASFLALEVMASLWALRPPRWIPPGPIAVVIPAHNEARNIETTIRNVESQLRDEDRIVVVADNCTDDTAMIARKFGVDCIERHELSRRGKGYALQFGIDYLRAKPPSIIAFIDADCSFSEGALLRIAGVAAAELRPAQALYLMQAPESSSRLRVAAFAWLFMNRVRMRGLQNIFGFSRFTGAGLAAPWSVLKTVNLASGEIVEDLAFTFTLIRKNAAPLLVDDALVTSEFPTGERALLRQSARWSIGSLAYSLAECPRALSQAIVRKDARLGGAALDLAIPPLTIFLTGLCVIFAISVVASAVIGSWVAAILSAMALALSLLAIATGWAAFGRQILPPAALGGVFRFLLAKANVFGSAGRKSARTWTPTRDDRGDS